MADACGLPLNEADACGSPLNEADACGSPLNEADACGLPLNEAVACGLPLNEAVACGLPLNDADACGLPLNEKGIVMTFPAARRGDSTTHGGGIHGSGYAKVRVGGKSAWRVGDMHICRQLNPPPPSNPHGPGMVLKGSFTVLIGGQPAARQSDVIMEPAAVVAINPIASGETTVLIGDLAFGLMTDAVLDAFCAKWTQLLNDWPTLTEDERKKRAEEAVNAALDPAGVPRINGIVDSASAAANAAYSRLEHRIFLPNGFFRSPTPPASRFGRSLIHEARHAEQAYNAGRYLAQKGWSARRFVLFCALSVFQRQNFCRNARRFM